MTCAVLVKDNNGVGEVIDWFSSVEEAIEAGKQLGGNWSVYVKEIEEGEG